MTRQRLTLMVILDLALLACVVGVAAPPEFPLDAGTGVQSVGLARVILTVALAVTLVLGPGLAIRAAWGREKISLGFLALPGMGLMALTGGLAWILAGGVDAQLISAIVIVPVLVMLFVALTTRQQGDLLEGDEGFALVAIGCALGLAVAKTVLSLNPEGGLYAGSISRTLEVGDRPDSRIPFLIVQIIANDLAPYGQKAAEYFAPYNFSSRGPLAGMSTMPVVALSGAKPPLEIPDHPWTIFDPQGFMAFRLTMYVFACTAFLSIWQIVRELAGKKAARFAVLLAVTTPFLVHEVWFTWPKLMAASFGLLGLLLVIRRKPLFAGLLVGLAYMMHPGGLLALSALGLIALWPLQGANWKRPRVLDAVKLVVGPLLIMGFWRVVNGANYTQDGFFDYAGRADANFYPTVSEWLVHRLDSLASTLIPLKIVLFDSDYVSINVVGGLSPWPVHFFFQYWTGVPFGFAIVFFPLLIYSLWKAFRKWPWATTAIVIVPFVAFTLYWGSATSGMMREGLHFWALCVIVAIAVQQGYAGFPWLKHSSLRALLALRSLAVLAVVIGPIVVTAGSLTDGPYTKLDFLMGLSIVGFTAVLVLLVWRERAPETGVPAPPKDATDGALPVGAKPPAS